SGNVVFETTTKNAKALEQKIEKRLREALGYEVTTFIRTDAELVEISKHQPFKQLDFGVAAQLNIIFLAEPLDDKLKQKLTALSKDTDEFHVRGREIYWLRRKKPGDPTIQLCRLKGLLVSCLQSAGQRRSQRSLRNT